MNLKPLIKRVPPIIALSAGVVTLAVAVDVPTAGQIQDNLKVHPNLPKQDNSPVTENKTAENEQAVPAGGKQIKVNQFVIEGNSIFTTEQLHQLIADKEGSMMTLKEVYSIADKLTKHYRDAGYSLATAIVPAQKVSGGTIKLLISEGKVDKLVVNGKTSYSDEFLTKQLDQIAPGTPIRMDALEREVLLLDGLPGLTGRSLIKPGEEQGTASVEFNTEEQRYQGLLLFDNAGSEAIGVYRATANVTMNNPLGIGDALTIGHTHTESDLLRNYQFGYNFPIGVDGTRVGLDYSVATFTLGGEDLKDLDINGRSTNLKLSVTHPFIRSRKDNLQGSIAVVSQTSKTRQAGVLLGEFDPNLTFLETSIVASRVHDDQSFTNLSFKYSQNGHRNRDGDNNNSIYGRFDLDISHERAIFPNWSLFTRFAGAYSIDPQMDLTKFGIGGPGSIRGFTTSETRGDYGYFTQIEARRFIKWNEDFTGGFKVFIDHGQVFRKDFDEATVNHHETLTGYGIGTNVTYNKDLNLDLVWAVPWRHNGRGGTSVPFVADSKDESRLWMTLSKSF